MKIRTELLFEALLFAFSLLLLVLMLLNTAALQQSEYRCESIGREIAALGRENELLEARCVSSMSLQELESYAREVLGMQTARPRQTLYCEITELP